MDALKITEGIIWMSFDASSTGSKLGPGLLLFHCLEHQKIIGIQVLTKPESPRMVFETILLFLFIIIYKSNTGVQNA